MMRFFDRFFSILDEFWTPSWSHVGAMLATKSQKKRLQKQSQKKPSKRGKRQTDAPPSGPLEAEKPTTKHPQNHQPPNMEKKTPHS